LFFYVFVFFFFFFFPEIRAVCEIMWKHILKRGMRQKSERRMRIGCLITRVTHTLTVCNNSFFPTSTTVARTPLSVTLYVNCLSCIYVALLTFLYSINRLVFCNRDGMCWICRRTWVFNHKSGYCFSFKTLALEMDIYSLAHHLCKMWIFYEPRRVTLGNTRHFVEE